jgi:hypothetical protein
MRKGCNYKVAQGLLIEGYHSGIFLKTKRIPLVHFSTPVMEILLMKSTRNKMVSEMFLRAVLGIRIDFKCAHARL